MTPERWHRVKDLFATSLEKSTVERAAFLEKACGSDRELLGEVERLLLAHEKPGPFLQAEGSVAGRRIGPYEVIRPLGRGGMGEVYLAARADGAYEKQVAIKLAPIEATTPELVARLRTERQILAALAHPNIAMLLDGGTTEEGLPYFVMEYVEGEPLDTFCEERALPIERRLRLSRTGAPSTTRRATPERRASTRCPCSSRRRERLTSGSTGSSVRPAEVIDDPSRDGAPSQAIRSGAIFPLHDPVGPGRCLRLCRAAACPPACSGFQHSIPLEHDQHSRRL